MLLVTGNFAELRKMAAHNISELPAASPLTDVHNSSHLQVPSPLGPGPSLSQRPSAYSIRPSNRSRTSSLSTTTSMRPEPGAFLFHSSTHVNLHDMVEEESSRVPATSKA